ncbi:MAG TPA: O-antigen polymerase [Cyanobacteria bacterium UBA8553]|nr:O-antigen polymerase [Cyanobacteria bacterium UBA8553]
MKYLTTLLFALSIVLIDPWGGSRGEIWTQPKVFALLLISLLNLSILWSQRVSLTLPPSWKISKLLWELFLGIGLLSTIFSPFPLRSLFGQDQMGDGWLYWLIIAAFTLSNTLLLRHHPELLRPQVNGLLIGGVILAISIFPQLIDWRIDYTATMGQLLRENILASTIFKEQQPIGLYSHRGHASFVLAAVAILTLVSWKWKWISKRKAILALSLIMPALLLTFTRAGVLALIVAGVYWFYCSEKAKLYRKVVLVSVLVALLFVGAVSFTRKISALEQYNFDSKTVAIKYVTSDRFWLWQQSIIGIKKRPLLGWGFNGFGIAYPYIQSPNWTPSVVNLGNFSFDYRGKNGQLRTLPIPTYKAHNLILDTTLSVGVLGLLCYGALLVFCFRLVQFSPIGGIEAVAVAYIAFTFTWFECAQFTHIAWWVLSLWGVKEINVGK